MLWILISALLIIFPIQADDIDASLPNSFLTNSRRELFVEANNEFTLHLYKYLAAVDGNVFFCATCLSSSLAMLMQASAKGTAAELNRALHYKKTKLNSTEIQHLFAEFNNRIKTARDLSQFSNALFIQKGYGLLPEISQDAFQIYNTELMETDFVGNPQQAIWDINESVKTKTHGKIKRLFERMTNKNSMLLTNTAYFKTNFKDIFDSDVSLKRKFYNQGVLDHNVDVYVMEKNNSVQRIAVSYDFRALELPCGGENNNTDMKMWIFLPHKTGNLPEVEYGLSTLTFKQVQQAFRDIKVNISIPRIRFDFSQDISKDLQKLGIQKAFEESADFSSLSDIKGLHLSQVLQRAIVEINEDASNSFPISEQNFSPNKTHSSSKYIPPFKANHPFLFCIIDTASGLILYIGRVFEF